MRYLQLISAATAGLLASGALAGIIHVSPIGGGIDLASGGIGAPVFGPGPGWAHASIAQLHASISASGIATDGKVTFAALDSDHGLAMVALVDQDTGAPGVDVPATVHMDGVSDGTSLSFTSDPLFISPPSTTTRIATGEFAWNSNGSGSGFGWANLHQGTTITWRFQKVGPLGLDEPATFQFVTWNGQGWSLIPVDPAQASFTASGEFGFSSSVTLVPAPGAAALGAIAAAGLLRRRRV
jgi:MYXO-CTERM domain-containing protein